MIKIDYASLWKHLGAEAPAAVLFARYGVIEQVVTNSLHQMLVQKLSAYVGRRQTQPRDIFDVVWLFAQGAHFDVEFAKLNGCEHIVREAQTKFVQEGLTAQMRQKLQPFLFDEEAVRKMELFPAVLEKLAMSP